MYKVSLSKDEIILNIEKQYNDIILKKDIKFDDKLKIIKEEKYGSNQKDINQKENTILKEFNSK